MRSLTREVKDEILTGEHPPEFWRGLLRGLIDAGEQRLVDGTPAVAVDNARTARVAHRIVGETLHVDAVVLIRAAGSRGSRFLLSFPGRGAEKIRGFAERPLRRFGAVGRRGYLAGLFLMAGTLTPPQSGYLFEVRLARSHAALEAMRLLRRFGLHPQRRIRRQHTLVYVRGADEFASALTLLGADGARLALEDARSVRSVRGEVNRLVNAEAANVEKSVRAAVEYGAWIREFASHAGLESLPPKLREAAEARLAAPDASLWELGRRLGLTKAGVHYRLRRIAEMAQRTDRSHGTQGFGRHPES